MCILIRDVSTGSTGATEVAPKFSDTLTLSPPGGGGGRFYPPLQRLHLNFPCGYVPVDYYLFELFLSSDGFLSLWTNQFMQKLSAKDYFNLVKNCPPHAFI